jgi:hypothetical protein
VGSNRSSKIIEWAMIGVMVSVVIPIGLSAMLCYLNLDPFWFVLPETENYLVGAVVWHMRFAGFSLTAYLGWFVNATTIMVTILGLKIVKETLTSQNRWTKDVSPIMRSVRGSSTDSYSVYYIHNRHTSVSRTVPLVSMHSIFAVQRQVRIVMQEFNKAYYCLHPVSLLTGQYILVVCNYATIKMQETIPMPFYLVMPGLSVFVVMLLMVLFPVASDVYECSLEFLRAVKLIAGRSRYWRRIWRSERAVKLSIGGFFFAKRSTKTTYLVQCVDATIDAILIN